MNIYQIWFLHFLFWMGITLAIVGIFLLVMPAKLVSLSQSVNKWISTDWIFDGLDQPRYKESQFYKRHRLWGVILLLGSAYVLYMLYFRLNVEAAAEALPIVASFDVNMWIYQSLVLFLLGVNAVVFILSFIIIIRPSILKNAEDFFNRWVHAGKPLERLDSQYQIPDTVLPGNVRLFGGVVLAGGIYIALSTAVLMLN